METPARLRISPGGDFTGLRLSDDLLTPLAVFFGKGNNKKPNDGGLNLAPVTEPIFNAPREDFDIDLIVNDHDQSIVS
jgi:hypothetical protein